jgi:hypothetical protein
MLALVLLLPEQDRSTAELHDQDKHVSMCEAAAAAAAQRHLPCAVQQPTCRSCTTMRFTQKSTPAAAAAAAAADVAAAYGTPQAHLQAQQ